MSHPSILQTYHPLDKSYVIEGRLTNQERTMSVLLEQALRIRDEVVASQHSTQGFVQSEASFRRLLESHIRTITHIVKQLSADIQTLENQMAHRDQVTSGTSFAVQSLDHKNLAGFGDLRGRVARCDASIAKLGADGRTRAEEILRLQQELSGVRSGLEERLRGMESKLYRAVSRLEGSLVEQSRSQSNSWTQLGTNIKLLGDKSSGGLRDVMGETDSLRKWTEQQLRSSAQAHTQGDELLSSLLQDKMVEVEGRLGKQLSLLSDRVERAERRLETEHQAERANRAETPLHGRIRTVETYFQEELQRIKQDYQSGFLDIHDAIDSLRHIVDSKARLDMETVQKDIKQIHLKIAELRDV